MEKVDEYGGHPPVIRDKAGNEQALVGHMVHDLFKIYVKLHGQERFNFAMLIKYIRDELQKKVNKTPEEFKRLCGSVMNMYCFTEFYNKDWTAIKFETYFPNDMKDSLKDIDYSPLNHTLCRVSSAFVEKMHKYHYPEDIREYIILAMHVVLHNLLCEFVINKAFEKKEDSEEE
jgi:mRNA-degrading endonuclease HigB of HigAB toxin-antitoxin module